MPVSRTRILSITVCMVICASSALAESKNKEAASLIQHAKQLSDIRAEGSAAFILKGDFKILRDPDHPLTGSYTEIWASSSLLRVEVSAGDLHSTKVINDRKQWELSAPSEIPKDIGSAANSIAYRIDRFSLDSRGPAKIIDRINGSGTFRCIVGQDDGFGGRQESCFDKSGGQLVAQSASFISQGGELVRSCFYSDFQKFGNKLFPRSIRCLEGERLLLDARIVQLTLQDPADKSVFAAFPGAKELPNCPVQPKNPEAIDSPNPVGATGGPVVLSLIVGTDGRPHDVKVVTSGGAAMDEGALAAVLRWRFKPGTCEGQPMESLINVAIHGSH